MLRSSSAGPVPVPPTLRWCVHLLVAGLLLLCVIRAVALPVRPVVGVVAASLALAAVYVLGTRRPSVERSATAAGRWLAALGLCWLLLLGLTADAVYLAFVGFFLALHLLPRRAGTIAVAGAAVAAIAGFAWHQGTFTLAMAIGPMLGAAVVIATVRGYQALHAESEHRQLIDALQATRAELSVVERRAGTLAERERLAREIHDTLAQGLSSIQLLLLAAGRSLDPAAVDPVRAAELVERARVAAQENLDEARRFVRALAPGALAGSSLAPALRRLCETAATRAGIPVTLRQDGASPALPLPVEVALLRIAQAALANVERHAAASRAEVTLTAAGDRLTLDIVDDGVGFDPAAVRSQDGNGGFGLRSMASRTAEVGGVISVESEPGQGTAVAVAVTSGPPR